MAVAVIGFAWVTRSQPTPAPYVDTTPTAVDTGTPAATSTSPAASPTPSGTTTPPPASYTLASIASHNSASSCWAAINGKVYNLTSWINQHPGGPERILSICGTDGSAAFNGQHAGQRQPASELTNFYIGLLAQ